jgi:hypothetical protein
MIVRTFALCVLGGVCATAQALWTEPRPPTPSHWTWGPGGQEMAPRPPFAFVKERFGGSNPKVEVRDAADRRWVVKFGSEAHTDTFAARFVSAMGYAAEPTFYVEHGTIEGIRGLKRAKHFVSRDGTFRGGRFKLHGKGSADDDGNETWSWNANPFVGSRELGGLKILVMLTSNWDTKDARDGKGNSNTGIIHTDSKAQYAVTDWGATLGKYGTFFRRNRWDWGGYRIQTANFVKMSKDGALEWGFKGKHTQDITSGVEVADVIWLDHYLSLITDEDLTAGFSASGASQPVAREYTRLMRNRILQLQRVAQSKNGERASQ